MWKNMQYIGFGKICGRMCDCMFAYNWRLYFTDTGIWWLLKWNFVPYDTTLIPLGTFGGYLYRVQQKS